MAKQRKQNIQHSAPMTKRQQARWEKERQAQRRVLRLVGGGLALALVVLVGGILWDKVYQPNKTVATVSGQEISNGDYQAFRQITQAQRVLSTVAQQQQMEQFGQVGGDYTTQIQADITALKQKNAPIDYFILDQMINNRLIANGAAAESLAVTDDEVKLKLAESFPALGDENPMTPITPTATISGTNAISGTNPITGTGAVTPTVTPTPAGTPTPTPTITLPQAQNRVTAGISNYYSQLKDFIENPNSTFGSIPLPFTLEQFNAYLLDQQRIDMLRTKLGEKLVTEDKAVKEPFADVDQIFIRVTVAPTATEEISRTLWASGESKIKQLYNSVQKGANFDELSARESETGSNLDGMKPLTDFASLSITGPISTQQIGVVGQPYRSEVGWHLVRVNAREDRPSQSDLETKRSEAVTAWITEQRDKAGVQRFPEPTPTPLPPTVDPALLPPTVDPAAAPTADPAAAPTAAPAEATAAPADATAAPTTAPATPTP